MIRLEEYQLKCAETAVYRENAKLITIYPVLGLIGEIGEMVEKLKTDGSVDRKEVRKEIGDVFWYCAISLADMGEILFIDKTMTDRQIMDFHLPVDGACKLAELYKKYLRDGNEEKKLEMIKVIGKIMMVTIYFCENVLEVNFGTIMEENLAKLKDRKDRGMIKGSGDNR